jgi:hypothetical protein
MFPSVEHVKGNIVYVTLCNHKLNTSLYDMDIMTEKLRTILKTFPTSIHDQHYILTSYISIP